MAFYLIDGLPGTGKTTVGKVLRSRGYEVYDGDEDGLAHWYSMETGEEVQKVNEERTPAFLQANTRSIDPATVKKLSARAVNKTMFITNDPQNLTEVADLFDKHFALTLDEAARQKRLDERTNNDWGKLPHEREYDSKIAAKAPERYDRFNHTQLDASQSPEIIADKLIELTSAKP